MFCLKKILWFAFGVMGLSGCAVMDGAAWIESQVRVNAQKRWDAVLAGSADESYQFFGQGSRARIQADRYRLTMPRGFWDSAKVGAVECSLDVCSVSVDVTYKMTPKSRTVAGQQTLKEKWIREDGQWFFVFAP